MELVLPVEVVTHIISFLPNLTDRKSASEVSHLWYQAYQDRKFRSKEVVQISNEVQIQALTKDIQNQDRKYFNFVFKEIEIANQSLPFWERFAEDIRTLSIFNCEMSEKIFVDIISRCHNLSALNIQNCRDLFISGIFLQDQNEKLRLQVPLKNLKKLNLSYNRYLSDAIFIKFITLASNIETLYLAGCQISFHSGLYKKFYPHRNTNEFVPSECVLTFYVILKFMKDCSHSIKNISFNDTLIDSTALLNLSEIENLQLNSLTLRSCQQLTNEGILKLCVNQKQITELDVALCPRITDAALIAICSGLPNLKYLSVQRCKAVTDLGINNMWKLEKLKNLNISECDLILGEGILKGLCQKTNYTLNELRIGGLVNIPYEVVIELSKSLPNLTYFDVSYCFNAITDNSIQSIIKNNKKLSCFVCVMCGKITDSGLTGMGVDKTSMESIKRSLLNVSNPYKISLGSNAEIEIINDAVLKQNVREMCESDFKDSTGYSLNNLSSLRKLLLSGCNKITDVSLKYCFQFINLLDLDLSQCQQITEDGLHFLSINNRSIESLNLNQCHNINDSGVKSVVKNLRYLKTLIIGSNKLTDLSADTISKYGASLKYLDIRNCSGISPEACIKLKEKLPKLENFYYMISKRDDNSVPVPPTGIWLSR